ncbi:hypothetical protein GQ600_16485 [Phytophthora cactorum]|nr:hypothetical protein GQ600_16485 [Phytophthora cactorum]
MLSRLVFLEKEMYVVMALVQELGNFVEDGFWMDAIKTHCFVTYPTSEIAEKTSTALNGKDGLLRMDDRSASSLRIIRLWRYEHRRLWWRKSCLAFIFRRLGFAVWRDKVAQQTEE